MISDDIDDIKVNTASVAYFLYRSCECPYGDNLSGFTAWLEIQRQAFKNLADPTGEDDATT
jgi:hypothetical protein